MARKTRPTVLVVEDDERLLETIVQRLEFEEFVGVAASTVEQAIRRLDGELAIQLLITDMILPDGDGEELAAVAEAHAIPVVFITGGPGPFFHETGAVTLSKPFRAVELLSAVRHALEIQP